MRRTDDLEPPEWLAASADELVLVQGQPSRNLLLAAFGLAFVILVAMSILVGAVDDLRTGRRLSWVIVMLTVGTILFAFVTIHRYEYVLTDERVSVHTGLHAGHVKQLALEDLVEVEVEQPTWQQWLGIGAIRFETTAGEHLRFSYVEDPYAVYQQILSSVSL